MNDIDPDRGGKEKKNGSRCRKGEHVLRVKWSHSYGYKASNDSFLNFIKVVKMDQQRGSLLFCIYNKELNKQKKNL